MGPGSHSETGSRSYSETESLRLIGAGFYQLDALLSANATVS